MFMAKTGMPWRDLPERFGPWKSVYNRFSNWAKKGRWEYPRLRRLLRYYERVRILTGLLPTFSTVTWTGQLTLDTSSNLYFVNSGSTLVGLKTVLFSLA